MLMKYRKDLKNPSFIHEVRGVRKTAQKDTPGFAKLWRVPFRMLRGTLYGPV